MSLTDLENLARAEEAKLRCRRTIGYTMGLKAGVLIARQGDSFEECIADAIESQYLRGEGTRDDYDDGFIDGMRKASNVMQGRDYP